MRPILVAICKGSGACASVALCLALAGCFSGDSNEHWADRRQVQEAAARCGVPDLKPTRAGAHWAAYVAGESPDHGPKGDCIYADLERQGLLATR